MGLSDKEKLFCSRYASTGDAVSSLKFAGFSEKLCTTKKALILLEKPQIKQKIQELRERHDKNLEIMVLRGLKKLAFGNVVNQVKFFMQKDDKDKDNLKNDLFNVQEIRIPRDGAIEIKFFNRQSAMEKLFDFVKNSQQDLDSSNNLANIFDAIKNS